MWNWKPAKAMLDRLWNHGDLVVAGRQGFQRLYDLPERVLPAAVLDAPLPSEPERLRELALKAVHARGALTEAGVMEHWRLRGGVGRIRAALDGLVDEGQLERLAVEDGGAPVRRACRNDGRPASANRCSSAVAVRQSALGPAVRPASARLRSPDRGLQAEAAAPVGLLRAAASLA